MTLFRRCLLIAVISLAVLPPGFLSRDAAAQKNKPIDIDSPGGPAYRKEHMKDGKVERMDKRDKKMEKKAEKKIDKKGDHESKK